MHPEDDDFVQPRALIDEVLTPGDAERLVGNVVAHARQGVSSVMRERIAEYWQKIHPRIGEEVGKRIIP